MLNSPLLTSTGLTLEKDVAFFIISITKQKGWGGCRWKRMATVWECNKSQLWTGHRLGSVLSACWCFLLPMTNKTLKNNFTYIAFAFIGDLAS